MADSGSTLRKLQAAAKGAINASILRITRPGDYDLSRTVIITGFPRSGTTWLSEMAAQIPGSAMLFEPLNIRTVPSARAAGFDWNNFVTFDESRPSMERYLRETLSGDKLNWWNCSNITFDRIFGIDRWIVKFVRANQMLPWLSGRFETLAPIMLVRHPCAVYQSWLARRWPMLSAVDPNPRFLVAYPQFHEVVRKLTNREEFFAAKWSMEHYNAFAHVENRRYLVISYEDLAFDTERIMREVFERWDLEMPVSILDHVSRPSAKASGGFEKSRAADIGSWQKRLDSDTAENILAVVRSFGIHCYGHDSKPDASIFARIVDN